jgi:hypothetical protein
MREHRTSFRRISSSGSFAWIPPQVRLTTCKSFAKIRTDLEASLRLLDLQSARGREAARPDQAAGLRRVGQQRHAEAQAEGAHEQRRGLQPRGRPFFPG